MARRLPARRRPRGRAARRRARAPEPRRTAEGGRARPGARLSVARGHRARRPRGLDARPVVGRDPRRVPVGPRHARHEGPDRRRGGRGGVARPQRLAPGPRRAEADLGRRRGDRRPARRQMADRGAARPRARRLARQRGRRAADAVRRPPAVSGLLLREGHVPVHGPRTRAGGARRDPRVRRQRAAQARAGGQQARRAPERVRRHGRAARAARGARRGPVGPAGRRSSASSGSSRGSPRWSTRRCA